LDIDLFKWVRGQDQHFTLGEREEVVEDVALNIGVVPDLGGLAGLVDLGDILVDIGVGVHGVPERFTVSWVITAIEALFVTIVEERNTSGSHREGDRRFEGSPVAGVAEEARVIVVVHERTKNVNVLEHWLFVVVQVTDFKHGVVPDPNILNLEVHGVVEQRGDWSLVLGNIAGIAIEALTHLEDTRSLVVLVPEVLGNFRDGVDADAVEVELLDDVPDPALEIGAHILVVLIVVREAWEPAILNLLLVIPVVDVALGVVVLRLVEGIDVGEVGVGIVRAVIRNDIKHHPDVAGMASSDQILKGLFATVLDTDLFPVKCTVTVIIVWYLVLRDWWNPDGVETHALDVFKVVLDTLESTTTVHIELVALGSRSIGLCKPICQDLINWTRLPFLSSMSLHSSNCRSE
jgi:hypothetical protein